MDLIKPKSTSALKLDDVDGVVDYLHFDETEKKFHHEVVQDIEPSLEHAKSLSKESNQGRNEAGDFYHAAHVPQVVLLEWLKVRNMTMKDFKGDVVKEFLNDSSNKAFRIWPGRV